MADQADWTNGVRGTVTARYSRVTNSNMAVASARGGWRNASSTPAHWTNSEIARNENARKKFRIRSLTRPIAAIRSSSSSSHWITRSNLSDPHYRTIDKSGPALFESLAGLSASDIEASFDCFACAIARWNSSHRCRADSFLSETTGDSVSVYLFDILFKSQM